MENSPGWETNHNSRTTRNILDWGTLASVYLVDGFTDGHHRRGPAIHLIARGEERHLIIANAREFRMTFVGGIDEMLDLAHCEFAHSDQTLTGTDLVAETEPDLCRREGKTALEETRIEYQPFH